MPLADQRATRVLSRQDQSVVEGLLRGTSRTFALAIPLLDGALNEQVGVSYLLFRIADSVEDAPSPLTTGKLSLLEQLRDSLRTRPLRCSTEFVDRCARLWPADADIRRLFRECPRLLALLGAFRDAARDTICDSLCRTVEGMSRFLSDSARSGQDIELRDLGELRAYCYYVAGVVGEMLTDLFVLAQPQRPSVHEELRRLGRGFGECLQLTNILKDADNDADSRRTFLPEGLPRERVFEHAFQSAAAARQYIEMLRQCGFTDDVARFCQLPLMLAEQTLSRVRRDGAGAKLTREEVLRTLRTVNGG